MIYVNSNIFVSRLNGKQNQIISKLAKTNGKSTPILWMNEIQK